MTTVGIDVASLFDATGSLGTNSLFYAMVNTNTSLNTYANTSGFLKDIQSVAIRYEDSISTSNFMIDPSATYPTRTTQVPNVDNPAYDIILQLQKTTTLSANVITGVLDGFRVHYDDVSISYPAGKDLNMFHANFQKYMASLIHDITTPFFTAAASNNAFPIRLQSNQVGLYYDALSYIGVMSSRNRQDTLNALDAALIDSLAYAYDNKGASPAGPDGDKLIFQDLTQDKLLTPFYYILRNSMVNRFQLPPTVYPSNTTGTAIFLKKLLVELYLKTQTPYIQFLYLQTMIKDYQDAGDFVNVRFCLLAQVAYLNCWLKAFGTIINGIITNNQVISTPNSSLVTSYISNSQNVNIVTMYTTIYNNINRYLANLNTSFLAPGDFSSQVPRDSLNSLINNLQHLSHRVQRDSEIIAVQQDDIRTAQISLRNTNEGIKQVKQAYTRAVTEFYILLSLTIVLMIVGAVLLILKKDTWVLLGSSALAIIILLYTLVRMIFSFFF